jgi:hypothetical protein
MRFISKNTVSTKTSTSLNTNGTAEVHHFKFLGLKIDVLSWNIHIDSVINKLTIVCFMIRSVRPYMTQSSLVNIYYSLFHLVLSYGIVFWGQKCLISGRSLLLYQFTRRVIKMTVIIIVGYHCIKYPTFTVKSIHRWNYWGPSVWISKWQINYWSDFLHSSDTGKKMGAQWDSTSAIHRFQESLWFSEEGNTVQHSYRVWNPHEISQAH